MIGATSPTLMHCSAMRVAGLFVPPDIVEEIMSCITVDKSSDQDPYSNCALASRSWSRMIRKHRYKDFSYSLDSTSAFEHFARYRCIDKFKSMQSLLRELDVFPEVERCIKRLNLSLRGGANGHMLERAIFDSDSDSDDESLDWQQLQTAYIDISLNPLLELVGRLPLLRSLWLPCSFMDFSLMPGLAQPQLPLRPLDLVVIKRGPLPTAYFPTNVFTAFISIFSDIRRLSLENVLVYDMPNGNLEANSPGFASHVSIQALELYPESLKTSIFSILARLPSAHLMTCLDLWYIPPENVQDLSVIIDLCSSSLKHLALQTNHTEYDPGTFDYLG